MKRIVSLSLCLSLLLATSPVYAKKRRKKGEPVICKKGKLIFEDDFSGKELLWSFEAATCEWKVVKKALATTSAEKKAKGSIRRLFTPIKNAIIEFRVLMPIDSYPEILYGAGPYPFPKVIPQQGAFSLCTYTEGTGYATLATHPMPYSRPRWMGLRFEVLDSNYALTIDGKSITVEHPGAEQRKPIQVLVIFPNKGSTDIFAIDDVKVWEALPLDEEDEKDKKKK